MTLIFNPLIDGAAFLPLEKTHLIRLSPDQKADIVRHIMAKRPFLSREAAHEQAEAIRRKEEGAECWASLQYTVLVYRDTDQVGQGFPPMDWLSIRRDDRAPIRDWRHMQAIKNQVCGPDAEGFEIYPADDRLVDTANQFHLWVFRDGLRIPVGWHEGRQVTDDAGIPGAVQRKGAGQ